MVKKLKSNLGVVYSTEHGKICPNCGNPPPKCTCKQGQVIPQGDGVVRVSKETKGRKDKGVSLVAGLPLSDKDLRVLAKRLKQKCGTGGTVKNGVIEIQGDHRQTLKEAVEGQGYKVKLVG